MSDVVDVVNFNADASCLSSARWLAALAGGRGSEMYRWFDAFVQHGKKVSLGLTGATIADLAMFNPEAIELVEARHDIFELVVRPFSHDVALLRSREGFMANYRLGEAATKRFTNIAPYFLPPEFMLTNQQVWLLATSFGIAGVFINASRFKREIAARIPSHPYRIQGVLGARLASIPVDGSLTAAYLDSLHCYEATPWNTALARGEPRFSWRDGESWLFLPDGLEREIRWLRDEAPQVRRLFVAEGLAATPVRDAPPGTWTSYPVHSFSAWVREFRMLGFLQKQRDLEALIETFTPEQLALWLGVINSDVLSAVEKDDPRFSIRVGEALEDIVLPRSERGLEGEDFLVMLEALGTTPVTEHLARDLPHLQKLRARIRCIAG